MWPEVNAVVHPGALVLFVLQFAFGGDPNVTYKVRLKFCAVFEGRMMSGCQGTSENPNICLNGTLTNTPTYHPTYPTLAFKPDAMRAELDPYGIRVTTVAPGLMRTGSPLNAQFKGQHEAEYVWFKVASSIPGVTISAERAARQILNAHPMLHHPADARVARIQARGVTYS